jgi:hypothetical protein
MTRQGVLAWLAGILVVAAVVAPGATAGKPTMERFDIDETVLDEFLSDACGVTVMLHIQGHVIERTFDSGPVQLNTLNIELTATAGGNTYRFRDVGADLTRVHPDGTAILSIIGQLPFGFTGVLKLDLDTGEAILEPHHNVEDDLDEACAILTA